MKKKINLWWEAQNIVNIQLTPIWLPSELRSPWPALKPKQNYAMLFSFGSGSPRGIHGQRIVYILFLKTFRNSSETYRIERWGTKSKGESVVEHFLLSCRQWLFTESLRIKWLDISDWVLCLLFDTQASGYDDFPTTQIVDLIKKS